MSTSDRTEPKGGRDLSRLSLWGLFKEIFNWYPAEYPIAERRLVSQSTPVLNCVLTDYLM